MALTQRQENFIEKYLTCFNKTQAAIEAGYSPRTAYSIGWENLKKPEIQEAISRRLAETAMSADEVLMRLAEHARGDMGQFLNANGLVDFSHGKSRLIKKFTQRRILRKDNEEEIITSIELYDAQAALALIGKHHGILAEKTELSGPNGCEMVIRVLYGTDGQITETA